MLLSPQFIELFRKEAYAVKLALDEQNQLSDPIAESVLLEKAIEGIYDKEYSVVPMGELAGRDEGNNIPEKNTTMGYTTYGAIAVEASGKIGLTDILKNKARELGGRGLDEEKFAGELADSFGRQFLIRTAQRIRKLNAKIFNFGGKQTGDVFFNHYERTKNSDLPNSNFIYDGKPLFALPANAHPAYSDGSTKAPTANPVGNYVDWGKTIADTGGYFNAFKYPPSYWALKRVWTHFVTNMQFDENNEALECIPDTLLVSTYNLPLWMEILESRFIEPYKANTETNVENVFMMEGFVINLIHSRDLVRNTWYLGKAKSPGIYRLRPAGNDDPWASWRDENNRTYWLSYEAWYGFMVKNWRYWCAGSISTDGVTAPDYGSEADWATPPSGI